MQHGLEGRRVAVLASGEADVVRQRLEGAGAQVEVLRDDAGPEESWHSARYSALVIQDAGAGGERALQLVREFLVTGKPVAAFGDGGQVVTSAGGTPDDIVPVPGADVGAFASGLTLVLAQKLEDERVDEMSDLSFPASDPPAVSPAAIGAPPKRDPDVRT